MSDLPPYIRDADLSPPPPPEAVAGQAGRPAVSPVQESALPLSGGGTPPAETRAHPNLGPNVVSQPGHVPYVQPYEPPPGAGGDQPAPAQALATAPASAPGNYGGGGDPAGFVPAARQGPVTQVVPPGQAVPAGSYTEDSFPIPDMHRADAALPVTPGPGGTAAVQSPEPAKTAAAPPKQQPSQEQPLAATSGGAVQAGPPPSTAQFKGEIPVHAYNILGNRHPELFNIIKDAAASTGVDPRQLMQTAGVETGFSFNNQKIGKNGETSIFQILPSTQKELEDKYFKEHFDLTKDENLPIAAKMAALYTHQLDSKFGAGSYASVAAYNGGPNFMNSEGKESAMRYAARWFDPNNKSEDYSKFDFGSGVGGTATANGYIKAVKAGGADGGMSYMVNTLPGGLSMTDGWQHIQSLVVSHFILNGDFEGAEKAQDFVIRQAFMGTNTHLMGALTSLERGDGMSSAQQLAKVHAFFPDGTAGRFMTNGKDVFAVRLDEATGKPLGSPFQIRPEDIRAQLKVTGNMMTFSKFLSDQQKAAADIRLHNAQAGVQEDKPALGRLQERGRDARAAETRDAAARNLQTREQYIDRRQAMANLEAAAKAAREKDPETAAQLDKFAKDLNADRDMWPVHSSFVGKPNEREYLGQREQLARSLKANSPGGVMAGGTAAHIADQLLIGAFGLKATPGGYAVVDTKTEQRVPGQPVVDVPTGEFIGGKIHPSRQQQQGGTANSASASGAVGGGGAGTVSQQQSGATRNQPISSITNEQLQRAAAADGGLTVEVYSGGQPSTGSQRTGSHRHDEGGAADLQLRDRKTGQLLSMRNPADRARMARFVTAAVGAGATGVGAAEDYMGEHGIHIGGGPSSVWGAGGHAANAPPWLVSAYNAGQPRR